MKMTLGTKLTLGGILIVLIPLLIVGFFSIIKATGALTALSEEQTSNVALKLASLSQSELAKEVKIVTALSMDKAIVEPTAKIVEGKGEDSATMSGALNAHLSSLMKQIGAEYENLIVVNLDGVIIGDSSNGQTKGTSVADRDYFKVAKEGKPNVGSVVKSRVTGNPVVPFAAPILSENQKIVGVFAAIQKIDALINEIAGTRIGKTGYAFMVDSNALIIAHPRKELILELNLKNLKGMEEITSAMLAHRKGVENYVFEGIQKIAAYAPVEMTGWSVGVTQPRDEFLSSAHTIRNGILIVGCVFLALTIIAVLFFARSISRPISRVVQGLSEGAEQVAAASSQVSSSSQSLAEGASEQAASLEETSSSLEEMTSMTRQNADHASEANGLMTEITRVVQESNAAMAALNVSMKDIAGASEETSKIIKTIDEIAFQTNLLALNAAVEAARAGEAGAGFAVVADEVRNLAIRAADAAKNTTSLIETTINKVKEGTQLVNRAGDAFQLVSSSTTKMGELVGEIAAASSEQAQGIDQINKAVAEMDKVVQQNAANAEESAAAAEELNAQAEQMKVYVNELVAVIGGTVKSGKNRRSMVGTAATKSSQSMQDISLRKRTSKANGQLKNSGNGKAKTGPKGIERRPEEIIPFDEEEFRDF